MKEKQAPSIQIGFVFSGESRMNRMNPLSPQSSRLALFFQFGVITKWLYS